MVWSTLSSKNNKQQTVEHQTKPQLNKTVKRRRESNPKRAPNYIADHKSPTQCAAYSQEGDHHQRHPPLTWKAAVGAVAETLRALSFAPASTEAWYSSRSPSSGRVTRCEEASSFGTFF